MADQILAVEHLSSPSGPSPDGTDGDHEPHRKDLPLSKTTCAITRAEFKDKAKAVEVVINGVPLLAEVKEFSTGSFGWYLNGKTTIKVGETPVAVQIGLNLTVVGSKEAT